MSALAWMIVRGITSPAAAAATFAAAGAASGLLLLTFRNHRTNIKIDRALRLATNAAGEVRALRSESECHWVLQDLWMNHKDTADRLFKTDDAPRH